MSNGSEPVTMCLWYDHDAEAAAKFYAATFPDSEFIAATRSPSDYPDGKEGDVLTVEFTVMGIPFIAINGGPAFRQDEAFSIVINTDTQEETDRYWNAIVGNGGEESMCGWCKDRFGLSWQVVPKQMFDTVYGKDPVGANRAMQAMLQMRKLDVAKLEKAYAGA